MKVRHLRVRSRNTSCASLRELVVSKRAIFRLGSTTPTNLITRRTDYIEINTADACKISGDKILMKQAFDKDPSIPTAVWRIASSDYDQMLDLLRNWKVLIIKHRHSSGGKGIYLISTEEDLKQWINKVNNHSDHIVERYYSYSREYRLHVTKEGCFLANRKMLKDDAEVRWHRHKENSVWINEDNPLFDKPSNWNDIVDACIKALNTIPGLDIAAFDVKIQTARHANPKFIILESNSAPALGERAIQVYKEQLLNIIENR